MKTTSALHPLPLPITDPTPPGITRRGFIQRSLVLAGGCALCGSAGGLLGAEAPGWTTRILSPGCRRSKVRVAKLYLGPPKAHWPTPALEAKVEMDRYEAELDRMSKGFADVEFVGNKLVSRSEDLAPLKEELGKVDGILLIHLTMGVGGLVREILALQKPTVLFAAPYSGHEWAGFGKLRQEPAGAKLECLLTSDLQQLAVAVRPFRAIHHLREAKLINVSTRAPAEEFLKAVADKFGTEIKTIGRPRMLEAYESIDPQLAEAETQRWMSEAKAVVEPPREEVYRSCRLALAFEKVLAEEEATAMTVDCYGSMYRNLPAFPCVGFVRLNDMGLAGICESDLTSAMTFLLLQAISGRPGFISDPTVDESKRSIILAHCLGSTRMDGPEGPRCPYKLRTIMERQEGCVPQVQMRVGQKVTQALLVGTDQILYFTGDIIDVPDHERGCRTKIDVRVDGDIEKLWQNWSHGLHRVTCYGDVVPDLKRFCRFTNITLVNEA